MKGWSNSTTLLSYITITLSVSIIVASLWAIMMTVCSFMHVLITFYIKLSVYKSMFAVASSNTNIFEFFIMVLAKHSSYFYPTEKVLLLFPNKVWSPWLKEQIYSFSYTYERTSKIFSSDSSLKGSRFSLIVPSNKNGV